MADYMNKQWPYPMHPARASIWGQPETIELVECRTLWVNSQCMQVRDTTPKSNLWISD